MTQPVYVIGHKNPDTDSIGSALGYAALKEQMGAGPHIAARAGEIGAEARFLLERFNVGPPVFLPDVRTKVSDVMRPVRVTVSPWIPLKEVYHRLHSDQAKMATVAREDGSLAGIVTNADLAVAFMGAPGPERLKLKAEARVVAEVLEGRLIIGHPNAVVSGEVYVGAMSPASMERLVPPGAVVITGDRPDVQMLAARLASCLIITGSSEVPEDVRKVAAERGIAVLVVPGDTYTVSRLVALSRPVVDVMNPEPIVFAPEDLLGDVIKQTREARHRVYPVTDEKSRRVAGLLYRDDLFGAPGRQLILVDHNEIGQAVSGLEEARILEVIDHHRLGDVQTREPVFVRNEPVGSTATIVSRMAHEAGVTLPGGICGMLLGAIVSDTLVFRSPTCTAEDRRMASILSENCGEDPETLGMAMLRAGSDVEDLPAGQLIRYNLKEYMLSRSRAAIAQCEVVDIGRLLGRKEEILREMSRLCEERQLDVMVMMLTEVLRQGTHILIVGPERFLVTAAFGQRLVNGGFYLPGVLSRKMQVLPKVTLALGS